MYPHRMRLHGPWQYEPLARTVVHPDGRIGEVPGPLPEPGRMKIPNTWTGTPLDGFRGRVRWRRHFHAPRALEPDERLWLVFDGVDYFADVSLNGTPLGRHEGYFERFEFDVTHLVRPRNELVVEVDCPAESDPEYKRLIRGSLETAFPSFVGGLWQDLALEVRSVAFLRDVIILTAMDGSRGLVTVTGRVVGDPAVPLSLDLSLQGFGVTSQKLTASPAGTAFRFDSAIESAKIWCPGNLGDYESYTLRLELHGKARTLDERLEEVGFSGLRIDPSLEWAEWKGSRTPVQSLDIELAHDPLENEKDDNMVRIVKTWTKQGQAVLWRTAGRVFGSRFYTGTDGLGFSLLQDFPLCGGYSTDPAFRAEAVRQAAVMVRQLAHHPSIALWSCHSDPSNHDQELDEAVRAVVSHLDPSRESLVQRFLS